MIMRICISQLNPTIGAIEENLKKILSEIAQAKTQQVDLIIFPEMAICGYCPDDLLLYASFIDSLQRALDAIIEASGSISIIIGTPRKAPNKNDKPLCNSAAIIDNGRLVGF